MHDCIQQRVFLSLEWAGGKDVVHSKASSPALKLLPVYVPPGLILKTLNYVYILYLCLYVLNFIWLLFERISRFKRLIKNSALTHYEVSVIAIVFVCDLLGKRLRNLDLIPGTDIISFCCSQPSGLLWEPTPFVSSRYGGSLPGGNGVGKWS